MSAQTMPSAAVVFDTLLAYQQSAALKSAIDLEVFTVIDDGAPTAAAIATRCARPNAASAFCATISPCPGSSTGPAPPINSCRSRPRS